MLMICSVLHVNLVCECTAEEDTAELDAGSLQFPIEIHTGYCRECECVWSAAISLCVAHCVFI